MSDGSQLTREGIHCLYKSRVKEILSCFMSVLEEAQKEGVDISEKKEELVDAFVEISFKSAPADQWIIENP